MAGIMGKKKKSSLFSAIKRIFSSKETDKKKGIWAPSETRSLFPLFRGPSSIEKILGEADQLNIRPRLFLESPTTQEKLALGKSPTPPKSVSPRACSSNDPGHVPPELFAASSSNSVAPCLDPHSHLREGRNEITCVIKGSSPSSDPEPNAPECSSNGGDPSFDPAPSAAEGREEVSSLDRYPDPEPDTLLASCSHCGGPSSRVLEVSKEISSVEKNASATKIQAAYRGHLVRRSYRASKGLARLQRVMRGQNVRRQTVSTMKQVQLHVRVQRHIQSQRKKVLENQTLKHQSNHTEKDTESRLSKRTLSQILSESTGADDWNDSLLTKEEEEAQLHKKSRSSHEKRESHGVCILSPAIKEPEVGGRHSEPGVRSIPLVMELVQRSAACSRCFTEPKSRRKCCINSSTGFPQRQSRAPASLQDSTTTGICIPRVEGLSHRNPQSQQPL